MLFPKLFIIKSSVPNVEVCMVHDAEQELALVDVHEKVEVLPKTTEVGVAVRLTVGNGLEPLPPHEVMKNKVVVKYTNPLIRLNFKHISLKVNISYQVEF